MSPLPPQEVILVIDDDAYIRDACRQALSKVGYWVETAVDGEEQPGELNWLHGMALDSKGNIYATDIIGQRVQKFVKKN